MKMFLLKLIYGSPRIINFRDVEYLLFEDNTCDRKGAIVYKDNKYFCHVWLQPMKGECTSKKEIEGYILQQLAIKIKDKEREELAKNAYKNFWKEG